jgi:hypothetical protein
LPLAGPKIEVRASPNLASLYCEEHEPWRIRPAVPVSLSDDPAPAIYVCQSDCQIAKTTDQRIQIKSVQFVSCGDAPYSRRTAALSEVAGEAYVVSETLSETFRFDGMSPNAE